MTRLTGKVKRICKYCSDVFFVYPCKVKNNQGIFCSRYCKLKSQGGLSKKHGMSFTREYNSWQSMKKRCYYEKCPSFPRYGGRGIKVCDRWLESFQNFYDDMGERPKNMTLDRVDVNGWYTPENCKWSSPMDQSKNRECTQLYDIFNERLTLSEISRKYNIKFATLFSRYKRGMTFEEAVTKPVNKRSKP